MSMTAVHAKGRNLSIFETFLICSSRAICLRISGLSSGGGSGRSFEDLGAVASGIEDGGSLTRITLQLAIYVCSIQAVCRKTMKRVNRNSAAKTRAQKFVKTICHVNIVGTRP